MNAIELYEKLFYVFAGMGALSLVLSVFLFFRFDIPQTFAMLTGKKRRKTIQEIENRNIQTGKLRQYPKAYTEEQSPHTARRRHTGAQSGPVKTGNTGKTRQDAARQKPAPRPVPAERPETEVLSGPAAQTVILSKPTGITEDLGQTEILRPVQEVNFYFQITENTVSIHTDELI